MHSVLWDCWRVYVLVLLLEVVHSTPKIMFSFKYCNDRLRIIRSFFLRDSKVSEIRQSARDFFFLLTPWPTPKPLANGRNIVGQGLSTLLDDTTYCVPLHILLHVVAAVWTPLQHLRQPSLELLPPFALSLTAFPPRVASHIKMVILRMLASFAHYTTKKESRSGFTQILSHR